jgi:hypothetical protein
VVLDRALFATLTEPHMREVVSPQVADNIASMKKQAMGLRNPLWQEGAGFQLC